MKLNTRRRRLANSPVTPKSLASESLEPRIVLDANPLLNFAVFAKQDVTIERNSFVASGAVGSDRKVDVKRGSQLQNIFAGDDIVLDKDAVVSGFVRSNGKVKVKKNTVIAGDIDAAERIQLESSVEVLGNVTSAEKVQLKHNTVVAGIVTEFGSPLPYPTIELPSPINFFVNPANDVERGKGQSTSLAAGIYGELDLDKNNTLHLTTGDYYFEKIDIKDNLQLTIDVSAGGVGIFVKGHVKFDDDVDVTVIGGDASDVYLETHGKFEMKKDGEWQGTIVAPFGNVKFEQNSTVIGAVYSGRKVEFKRDSQLTLAPSDYLGGGGDTTPPELSVELLNDTGIPGDGVTSNPAVSGTVMDTGIVTSLTLFVPEVSPATYDITAQVEPSGEFSLDRADLETLIGGQLVDGDYTLVFVATDDAGNESVPLAITVTVDTVPPPVPVFDLATVSDTPPIGDQETLLDGVTLVGMTEPEAEVELLEAGQVTTSNGLGEFAFPGVQLLLGTNEFTVVAGDVAGNQSEFVRTLTRVNVDDTNPPDLAAALLNDTGPGISDRITTDASLTGTVSDASPFELTLEFYNTLGDSFFADVTSAVNNDGTFTLSQVFLETELGFALVDGVYTADFTAIDDFGNESVASVNFYWGTVDPIEISAIDVDTGANSSDGYTSDNTLIVYGTGSPFADVVLTENNLGQLGAAFSDSNGAWTVDATSLSLADGAYELVAEMDLFGTGLMLASAPFSLVIDTTEPSASSFGLDPASDTGNVGDGVTTLALVNLVGVTDAGATVRLVETGDTTVASADGSFGFSDVELEYGRQSLSVEVTDLAGNVGTSSTEITYDFSVSLSESSLLVTEASFPVKLSQDQGTRTISFDVEAVFDSSDVTTIVEDTVLIYLVDPSDPTQTLLDRGTVGTSLFALSGDGSVDYPAGLVNYDGTTVQIDVTSLGEVTAASLLVQLVSMDTDSGTTVTLSGISNSVNPDDVANPVFNAARIVDDPAGSLDLTILDASSDFELTVQNPRLNTQTGRYTAELSLRNLGSDVGRNLAVLFPGLPTGVTLSNASGMDGSGSPYVNMSRAILPGGLFSGDTTYPVLLEFDDPSLVKFALSPTVLVSTPNSAPLVDPVSPITLFPGDHFETQLTATDADGDRVIFSIATDGDLPTGTLDANGRLIFTPTPGELGVYNFEVVATDGPTESRTPVTVTVQADPVTTTRISGVVLNTSSQPLSGVPVELGADQTLTFADGTFLLELSAPLDPNNALLVRGEAIPGPDVYPFIAEKLPLLIGHDGYESVNNVIKRPIYLPILDVASGSTIDPATDVTVTTAAIPGAAVFVAAGTLDDQSGNPFTGVLSITEVPAVLTPAALPPSMFPDVVVTIQPGEMVFTSPAPLTLPNSMGILPGTTLDLMSINPTTGLFDNVGTGQVSADGSVIETISGGINNSSWHFFNLFGPTPNDPQNDPRNQDKNCDDNCESRDAPESNPPSRVDSGSRPGNEHAQPSTEQPNGMPGSDEAYTPWGPDPVFGPGLEGPMLSDGGFGRSGGGRMTFKSDMFDPPQQPGPAPGNTTESNRPPETGKPDREMRALPIRDFDGPVSRPVSDGEMRALPIHRIDGSFSRPSPEMEIALHSGAVYKNHTLVPYKSLQVWRELELSYDSERADPRPIIHTSFSDVANSLPEVDLISKLAVKRGNFAFQVMGFPSNQTGRLTGGEHFFKVPDGATTLDVSLQADMRTQPSGLYTYESTNRFGRAAFAAQAGGTAATVATDDFVHVNTINSPFGAGWGLSGLLELVENPDGSVLMIDGSGGENLFKSPPTPGAAFVSPPGDFTTLELLPNGIYRRTHTDQTVQEFNTNRRLASSRDRNGNETQFLYNAFGIERIVDPLGLETVFRYTSGFVTEIEDPTGRITKLTQAGGNLVRIEDPDTSQRQFKYDHQHRLTTEFDKNLHADRIAYDFAGRVTTVVRKDGTRMAYSPVQTQGLARPEITIQPFPLPTAATLPADATATIVDPNGNVTTQVLDKQGQLRSAVDGAGVLPGVDRNADNLIKVHKDGRGNVTLYEYDDRGNVTSVSDAVSRGSSSAPIYAGIVHAVESNPIQVITADVNADGFADAITANQFGDSVSVLLGNGTGGFGFRTDYAVNDPRSLTLADLNGDTFEDLVTGNRDGTIAVLLANPDGTFGPATNFPAGSEINFVHVVDLNADGSLDVVAADYGGNSIVTLLGTSGGSLGPASTFPIGTSPASLAVGDFNRDGAIDVVTANALSSDLSLLLGTGNGTFGPSSLLPLSGPVTSVKVADVTGDGELDAVATNGGVAVSVVTGNGDGTFTPAVSYGLAGNAGGGTSPPFQSALDIADVDRDGDFDLFVAEGIDVVTVLTNDGDGAFTIRDSVAALSGTVSVSSADLNLDGQTDVVVLGNNSQSISGIIGNGDGTFVDPPQVQPDLVIGNRPIALDAIDVNNDGHLDVVTANQNDETISVLLGNAAGELSLAGTYPAGPLTLYAGGGDLDGDGDLDLVTTNYATDSLSVLLGDGTGAFALPVSLPAGAGPIELVLADLDQDGDLDVVSAGNRNSVSQFSVLLNHGDATFAPAVNTNVGFSATSPDVADINGDGFLDLAVANAASSFSNRVNIRLGNGDGTFQNGVEWTIGGSGFFPGPPSQVKLADVTGDGLNDIVATDTSDDKVVVRAGLGDGTFDSVQPLTVGDAPSSVDIGDVDADGIVDLIVANQGGGSVTVWFGKGDGTFHNRSDFAVGAGPSWVRFADLNDDDLLDLVATNRDADSLTVRLNTGQFSSRTGKTTEYDTTFSQPTRTIDEEGRTVLYGVDPANGNTLSITQVIGQVGGGDDIVTQFTYTTEGLVDLMIDPLGRVTDADYDAWGRLTQVTYAVGTPDEASKQYEFDLAGNLAAIIDELDHRTEFEYDAMNRLTRITEADPDGPGPLLSPVTTYVYDAHGNLTLRTDALQRTHSFVYDAKHRVIEDINDDNQKIIYTHDNSGNVTKVVDRLGRETSFAYDDRNRTIARINALGGRTETLYDLDNNVIRVVDENRNTTQFSFDARNRLLRTVNALGGVNSFEFDRVNNLTALEDELSRRTEMAYDELDRNISQTLPDPDQAGPDVSPVLQFAYDKASNLVTTTDALGNVASLAYDNRDRLIIQTDADPDGPGGPLLSPTTVFSYDDANRLISVSDPLSRVTTYVYDDLDRLVTETYPDPDGPAGPQASPVMTFAYDAEDFQTAMTDALGNVTQYQYDNLYRLVQITGEDPDGSGPASNPITRFTYDEEHQLLTMSDPLNRVTSYEYDALGRLEREVYPDPDGPGPDTSPVMTYTYDRAGNQTSMTDALGNVTAYAYDKLYRTIRIIEADPDGVAGPATNRITTFEFDPAHQTTAVIDPLGRKTQFAYDELGRVIQQMAPDPDGPTGSDSSPVTTFVYDLMNNERSMTDALGKATEYTYDNLYRLTSVIQADPDGPAGPQSKPTTRFEFDVASQMTQQTDPLGRVTTYEYDDLGRLIQEIAPDPDGAGPLTAPRMTYSYDLMNNELSMTDAVGNVTAYGYDNLYRLVTLIEQDPDGAGPLSNPVTQYTYDIGNQLLSTSDPLSRTTTYQYDDLGRLTIVRQPDPDGAGPLAAPESTYTYDSMSNKRSATDPLGHVTQYEYDNLYRLVRQVDEDLDGAGPLGNPTTAFNYDAVNNLLSLTDAVGNRTDYVYDDLDRMRTETIELGPGNSVSRHSTYDLQNNLIQRTDRNGRTTDLEYDNLYRLVEERWLDGSGGVVNTIQFEFDEASQMLRAEDLTTDSRYDYAYDDLSRVVQTNVNNGGQPLSLANAYDAQSRRTQQTATVGGLADFANTYSYDGLNRVTSLSQAGQGDSTVAEKQFDFSYNAADQRTAVSRFSSLSGGAGDLVLQTTYGHDGIGRLVDMAHSNSASTIVDYDWTYDAASRITQFHSSVDGSSDYDYDNGNQLTGTVHAAQADESYDYDENGNRTNAGYSTGVYNRLSSDGTFAYEYDAEGNRTQRTKLATGEVTDYVWDHRNRLVRIIERPSEGGPATNSVAHRYDAFNRWISKGVEMDGDGPALPEVTRYEYDGNQIVLQLDNSGAVSHRYTWGPGVDQLLADEQLGGEVYWPAADHLGTIREIIDSSGTVANHIVYDSFGNIASESNTAVDHLFGYTGRALDESTGLQNNLNRWYDASIGRWTSEDPIGFRSGDANPFRYIGNGPLTATDPAGLAELTADKLREALPYAKLAESAYTTAGMEKGQIVGNYEVRQVFDSQGGFRAVWFENTIDGEGVLAFAGTEVPSLAHGALNFVIDSARAAAHALLGHSGGQIPQDLFKPWHDVIVDGHQGRGGVNIQYEQAIRRSATLKERYGDNLTVVGHSLGGGLATAAGLVNGVNAKVFNPAGVHPNTLRPHGIDHRNANNLIEVFRLWADPLTSLQDVLRLMPDTVGTVYEIPTTDNGMTFWLDNHGMSRLIEMATRLLGGTGHGTGGPGQNMPITASSGGGSKSC